MKIFKIKHLAVLASVLSTSAFVSCSNVLTYKWETMDIYGTPIPTDAAELHKYLSFESNEEGISSTSAKIASEAINKAEKEQKVHALLSFARPKTNYIPDSFDYDITAKINDTDSNAIDITLIATSKQDSKQATIEFTLKGFANSKVLSDNQKTIINNNILEVNGLRYLIDGFDISTLNDAEVKSRNDAYKRSKIILEKYDERKFSNNPLANMFYSSTFDNGIKKVNFDNSFRRSALKSLKNLAVKYIGETVTSNKNTQATLDQSDPNQKTMFDDLGVKISELEAIKVQVNDIFKMVKNDTTEDDLKKFFDDILALIKDKSELKLAELFTEFAAGVKTNIKTATDFFKANIKNSTKKAEVQRYVDAANTTSNAFDANATNVDFGVTVTDLYSKVSDLFLQVLLGRNFENALSVSGAEFIADKGANELISKTEAHVQKDSRTGAITNEGFSNAPRVRIVLQKMLSLAQAYLINEPTNTLYKSVRLKEVITEIMNDFAANYFFDGQQQYVNWWLYEIGIPIELTKLLGVLNKVYNDELTNANTKQEYEDKFKTWSAGINYFLPDARYGGAARTAIVGFVPVTKKRIQTGANVIDTAKLVIETGILTNNIDHVQDAILAMYDNLFRDFVKKGDGFYRDGSYIQHDRTSYIGSYGAVLYNGVADIFKYFENSDLDLAKDKRFEKIYQFTELAVMPFMFKMSISDGLSGRSIVREGHSDKEKGMNLLGALTIIINGAPAKYKARLNNFILEQVSSFNEDQIKELGKKYKVRDMYIKNLIAFLSKPKMTEDPRNDEDWKFYETNYFNKKFERSGVSTSSQNEPNVEVGYDLSRKDNGLWFTKNQDRYVWKQKDFMFNINLRGRVIGFPESTLGENSESYYYNDGATLLHTSNQNNPYSNEYWTVINPEMIPGTSSSHTDKFDPIYQYNYPDNLGPDVSKWTDANAKSEYENFKKLLLEKRTMIESKVSLKTDMSYNNGIVFENMGYVKAMVKNWKKDLTTRKAYFMIENQIIVIGSAYGAANLQKKTTIENRLPGSPTDASYSETNVNINSKNAQKFVYHDTVTNEKNGYYVFDNNAVSQDNEENKYAIIANSGRDLTKEKNKIKRTYKSLTIDHSNNPNFAYSIVPNYDDNSEQNYLNVLNNFKIIVNNEDYIVASYTKDVNGKKVTTYFISSFFEPNDANKQKDMNGKPIGDDQMHLAKVENGISIPELGATIHLDLPTTLIIQKEEGSNVWKGISSSDTNQKKYEIQFNKTFTNFDSKLVKNEKLNSTNKENNEARLYRKNADRMSVEFFNNYGRENNIKHNTWFTMEEQ